MVCAVKPTDLRMRRYWVIYFQSAPYVTRFDNGPECLLLFSNYQNALRFLGNRREIVDYFTFGLFVWEGLLKEWKGYFSHAVIDAHGTPGEPVIGFPLV